MKRKVLVIQGLHPEGLRRLEGRDDVVPVVLMSNDEQEIIAAARDVEAITVRTARITRAVIDAAPQLRIVARHGVGYDAVDVAALTGRGIPLAIAPQSNMVSVAEHVMFMLLTLAKEATHYDAMTRSGDWGERWNIKAWDLAGKKLLVIGFGRTGSRVARRALAFDMQVHACDPYIDQDAVFGVRFTARRPLRNWIDLTTADKDLGWRWAMELLKRGLLVNPNEKFYISIAHSDADVEHTLGVVDEAFAALRAG